MRSVEGHDHEKATDQTRTRQGDDPAGEDEADLLPVDGTDVEVAQGDSDGGTSQTLSCRDRESETTSQKYCDSRPELHRKSACRGDLGDLVAEGAHNVVAVEPETDTEKETGDDEDPDGGVSLLGDLASGVGVVRSNPGTNSIGN